LAELAFMFALAFSSVTAVSIAFPALARLQRWTLPIWNF
jgi:hypothetical protein